MQAEDVNLLMKQAHEAMDKAIEHLQFELTKVRTGKASSSILIDIVVDYYGHPTPISQVSSVSTADARTLVIQPYEKSLLRSIEKAIMEANIGITPMNDGEVIRLAIPPLTEERRRDLVKQAKHLGEEAKIGIRSARHKALEGIKKAMKDGYPEDFGKKKEKEIEDLVKSNVAKIDHIVEVKEKDVMTV